MGLTTPKQILINSKILPLYKTLAENKLGFLNQFTFHRNFSRRRRLSYKNIESKNALGRLAKKKENIKFPSLIYIQNLLKTQPNFKLRSLFRSKNNALEWPLFDRNIQYERKFNLKNLVRTRLSADVPFLNDKQLNEIQNQKYEPQRVKNLGPDLAAVHFFVDRRASIRLTDQNDWIVGGVPECDGTEQLSYCLIRNAPDEECYVTRCYIEALDCSNFAYTGIRYEGLRYLAGLKYIKWLSLKNQRHINVWCLDRIAGLTGNTLEYLDISKCDLDLGCIIALSRMHRLETLVIKDQGTNNEITKALTCLIKLNPKLTVKSVGIEQNLSVPAEITNKQSKICKVNK